MKKTIFGGLVLALALSLSACKKEHQHRCGEQNLPGDANKQQNGTCCTPNLQEDCICPMVYDPVCGCDGVTYGNDCEAGCHGISFTPGPCPGAQ